jgi:hypothetical protein
VKIHIKVLAVIYLCLGTLTGLFSLVVLFSTLENIYSSAAGVFAMIAPTVWLLRTGLGLWHLQYNKWLYCLVTAFILMFLLNILLLLADNGKFASSMGQKIFHLVCIAIGLYTIIILLLPKGKAFFKN